MALKQALGCTYCGRKFSSPKYLEKHLRDTCSAAREARHQADLFDSQKSRTNKSLEEQEKEYEAAIAQIPQRIQIYQPAKQKPTLVKCGRHYINPADVREIREVKDGLYIVKFLSENNPEFPCWIREADIAALIQHFNIIE